MYVKLKPARIQQQMCMKNEKRLSPTWFNRSINR